jgi:hypothetical protein
MAAGAFGGVMAVIIALERSAGPEGEASRRAAVRREMKKLPGTPIAAVENGDQVRLTGRAVARAPLRMSPISQLSCICYRLTIEVRQDIDDNSEWRMVVDQDEFDSFVLTDATGEAVLHPPFRIALIPWDARLDNVPQAVLDLANEAGANVTRSWSTSRLRYFETVLQPGDEITAVGRAAIEIDQAGRASSHRELPVMCHLRGSDESVTIADAEDPWRG